MEDWCNQISPDSSNAEALWLPDSLLHLVGLGYDVGPLGGKIASNSREGSKRWAQDGSELSILVETHWAGEWVNQKVSLLHLWHRSTLGRSQESDSFGKIQGQGSMTLAAARFTAEGR